MQDFLKGRSFVLRPWWQRRLTHGVAGFLVLAIGALALESIAPPPGGREPVPALDLAELRKFQGRWEVVAMEEDGVVIPLDKAREDGQLTIEGSLYIWDVGARGEITRLDASASPNEVDYLGLGGVGIPQLGIYQFMGMDKFRDCFSMRGDRPADFKTWKGSGYKMITYRRVK